MTSQAHQRARVTRAHDSTLGDHHGPCRNSPASLADRDGRTRRHRTDWLRRGQFGERELLAHYILGILEWAGDELNLIQ